jgi:hypothetical protein
MRLSIKSRTGIADTQSDERSHASPVGTTESSPGRSPGYSELIRVVPTGTAEPASLLLVREPQELPQPQIRGSELERSAVYFGSYESARNLSSRPERSWACGPPKVMKIAFRPAITLRGSATLPLSSRSLTNLSSRPKRSVVERSAVCRFFTNPDEDASK